MLRKIRQHSGDTIVEVLLALLIAVLCITFMTNSIVSASKVNKQNREYNGGFSYTQAMNGEPTHIKKDNNAGYKYSYGKNEGILSKSEGLGVDVYENDGYYFAKTLTEEQESEE